MKGLFDAVFNTIVVHTFSHSQSGYSMILPCKGEVIMRIERCQDPSRQRYKGLGFLTAINFCANDFKWLAILGVGKKIAYLTDNL